MRHLFTTLVLIGALAASSAAFAQTSKPKAVKPAATKPAAAATHSVQGVVKSIDASSMVITKSGKKGGEMTFALDASTQRDGAIATGSTVSVRYRMDGSTNVATAVKAHASKVAKK